jgi:hypothetical protein
MEFPVQFEYCFVPLAKKKVTRPGHFFSFTKTVHLFFKQSQFFQFKVLNIMHPLLIL